MENNIDKKINELTIEELESELISRYGNLADSILEKDLEEKILDDLRKIDGLPKFLQGFMNMDIIRYFQAQDDNSRNIIRGAYQRTMYLKNKIKAKKKLDKSDNKRYK